MIDFWTSLSYTTRFSVIACISSLILTMLSMGAWGALLYYPVSFLFQRYPTLNDWEGDWVWPAVIVVGLIWSFSFLVAGVTWHYLLAYVDSVLILRIVYGFVLWLMAALLYFVLLRNQFT